MAENTFKQACKIFAKQEGVAVLKGNEDTSITRWIGAGALSQQQLRKLDNIYNQVKRGKK